jgi:hypothetical protein
MYAGPSHLTPWIGAVVKKIYCLIFTCSAVGRGSHILQKRYNAFNFPCVCTILRIYAGYRPEIKVHEDIDANIIMAIYACILCHSDSSRVLHSLCLSQSPRSADRCFEELSSKVDCDKRILNVDDSFLILWKFGIKFLRISSIQTLFSIILKKMSGSGDSHEKCFEQSFTSIIFFNWMHCQCATALDHYQTYWSFGNISNRYINLSLMQFEHPQLQFAKFFFSCEQSKTRSVLNWDDKFAVNLLHFNVQFSPSFFQF